MSAWTGGLAVWKADAAAVWKADAAAVWKADAAAAGHSVSCDVEACGDDSCDDNIPRTPHS